MTVRLRNKDDLIARIRVLDDEGQLQTQSVRVAPGDWDGSHADSPYNPRYVDELRWADQAVQVREQSVRRLSAMVMDRRNWSDDGAHKVNDDFSVVAMVAPTTGKAMAVAMRFAGWVMPGTMGTWQRFRMERWEADSYIECSHIGEAEQVAFQWASQWQQELAYDLEGCGDGDRLQEVVGQLRPSWLMTPHGRHPGWDRPPSQWKVRQLGKTGTWGSSPFAGMRNTGAQPDSDG